MDTLELIDKREQLRKQATEIVDGAKKETRMLSNDEQKQFDSLT
jgi:F0F1-type ATP synthase membrane subunit b/b'